MSFLKELRDTAKIEADELMRFNLRRTADDLQKALDGLAHVPTDELLRAVNGLWAHGKRLLTHHRPIGDSTGRGAGLREGARLAA